MASTPFTCPRDMTDKHRTATTNSISSHHHDSAPSRPHLLICTGAEPFHPVHASSQLGCAAVAPRNEVIFLPFWRVFLFRTVFPPPGFLSGKKTAAPNRGVMVTQKVLTALLKSAQMIYIVIMYGEARADRPDEAE